MQEPLPAVTSELEERLESSGPDLPPPDHAPAPVADSEIDTFVQRSARRLAEIVMLGAERRPGWLVLNPLSFARTVTVELPGMEVPLSVQPPIRAIQLDAKHRQVTLSLPGCGYVWIPAEGPKTPRTKSTQTSMVEESMIRNEFIEVYVNEATGGIGASNNSVANRTG